jgi:hypothetical protein
MRADKLAGNTHTNLREEFKERYDCLHFLEQPISLFLHGQKVTSKIIHNVAHSIYRTELEANLRDKEDWSENTREDIAWPSFKIAFNKIPTPRQPPVTKLVFSVWCTNKRQKRDQGRHMQCRFCEHNDKDWQHVLTCP